MRNLNDFKILKRIENLATSILGSRVITRYIEGGIRSKISSKASEPSLIEVDTRILANYSDNEMRALIFHEVAHHKYSPIFNMKKLKLPTEVFEALEENRIESKVVKYIGDKNYSPYISSALSTLRESGQVVATHELQAFHKDKGFLPNDLKPTLYLNTMLHLHFQNEYYIFNLLDRVRYLTGSVPSTKNLTDSDVAKVYGAIKLTEKALLEGTDGITLQKYLANTKDTLPIIVKKLEKVWPEIKKLIDWPDTGKGGQVIKIKVPKCLGNKKGTATHRDPYLPNDYDKMIGQTFGRQVQVALINKSKTRYMVGLKSGKLNIRHASRLLRDRIDIFKKRKETSKKVDYHITIAIDHSGSMAQSKRMYHAQRSAYLLYEAFKEAKIKLDFYSFDDTPVKLKSIDEVLNLQPTGGTATKAVVDAMGKDKITSPNTKKINIVLTDGQDRLNKEYVKEIEKKSNSQFVGIGLGMDTYCENLFNNMFENKIAVEKPEELPARFVSLCRRLIL